MNNSPVVEYFCIVCILAVTAGVSAETEARGPSREPTPLKSASPPTDSAPADNSEEPVESAPGDGVPKSYYFKPKSAATARMKEPVDYARPLSELLSVESEPMSWVLFGVEQRTRFEIFDDDYANDLERNTPFLLRSRAFLGVQKVLDPLRFGVEFQDSRQFNSISPQSTKDVDENDLLQAYAELYFEDLLGPGEPLSFQFGRLAVDYVDRRLRSRNGFRNTTNAFDGFRLHLGDMDALWELDVFAVQPVEIRTVQPDRSDEEQWFYGVAGAWRGWAPTVTIEPYYFALDVDNKGYNASDVDLHTFGARFYGDIPNSSLDYDVDAALQYGRNEGLSQRAFAIHSELGYTFSHSWRPRLAAQFNYASGDGSPNDGAGNRFDGLFGARHAFYGFTDYFVSENLIQPALELRFHPDDKTEAGGFYRVIWLASAKDAWVNAGRSDPTGDAGSFVGQEFDLYLKRQLTKHFSIEVGYAYFLPGSFVRDTGDAPDSDRFYVQTVFRL